MADDSDCSDDGSGATALRRERVSAVRYRIRVVDRRRAASTAAAPDGCATTVAQSSRRDSAGG